MKQSTAKYLAAKEGLIDFLSSSLDRNEQSKIKQWIEDVLLNKELKIDRETKIGFFEAEKALLKVYLEKGNIENIKKLFQVFNSCTNEVLNKIEYEIFTTVLKEKQDVLTALSEGCSTLKEILRNTFNKLTQKGDAETETYNEALSLLGQDNDFHV